MNLTEIKQILMHCLGSRKFAVFETRIVHRHPASLFTKNKIK